MWKQWINALLGLWIIAMPFLNFSDKGFVSSMLITGIIVLVLSMWSATEGNPERTHREA